MVSGVCAWELDREVVIYIPALGLQFMLCLVGGGVGLGVRVGFVLLV